MVQKELHFQSKHTFSLSRLPTGEENTVWIVFHGYGQLPKFFLRKFNPLFDESTLIVAPEGLNHFYLQGFSGRVGANWMTKHEREIDIANSNAYLNAMMDELLSKYEKTPQINVLGFSQGAATMSRWVCQLNLELNKVVFWAGAPAYDLDTAQMFERLNSSQIILALGDNDPFLQSKIYSQVENRLSEAGFANFKELRYSGGHEIDPGLLKEIFLM
ncbi:alpha/beta hydrolase [uncultured Cyclobacterium sp.]|uniref:alpha/beta hydrolase n=1 Tax=uncultured Cyclobacterium sp. TaxID=453820 RepID=UPI0030ED50F0